jgi:hypothetical protein
MPKRTIGGGTGDDDAETVEKGEPVETGGVVAGAEAGSVFLPAYDLPPLESPLRRPSVAAQ